MCIRDVCTFQNQRAGQGSIFKKDMKKIAFKKLLEEERLKSQEASLHMGLWALRLLLRLFAVVLWCVCMSHPQAESRAWCYHVLPAGAADVRIVCCQFSAAVWLTLSSPTSTDVNDLEDQSFSSVLPWLSSTYVLTVPGDIKWPSTGMGWGGWEKEEARDRKDQREAGAGEKL